MNMITEMENIIKKINELPEEVQTNIAFFLEQEIAAEEDFDKKISETSDKLSGLAQDALAEFERGETEEKGFDDL